MAMTIARLHKQLTELMEQGHGRKRVCIDKATFTDPLEDDGVTIMDVTDATEMTINVADGDGWTATNADGSEKTRKVLVLGGGHLREVPNAPHEGRTAALSPGVPLDAVVGPLGEL